ncbi:shikimate dehydrogenase [Hymenobacter ginsengisoli]|uniref:Shikimate dehydrogenase n=1 Tax=Hymenobacter ginsengisoli TaxID=1051626 RepID=A0ABP8QBR3_9BACT|nr:MULTISPECIES: shikimate dehydrogenase [unclassified Hymenobacter]MBO2032136.1 shikimate dehydrogenase [Hymenobacter sp. BT559]
MRVFGLLGRSLAHSFSQAYFTKKFEQLGLTDCRYELFELAEASDLPALLARQPYLAGLNVTIPYKEKIWPYLTRVAPSAAVVGAVNVIEFLADGGLVGHNTDYLGFRESLRTFYPLDAPNRRALVLGTGGAAKAVAVALQELAIPYQFVSRGPQGPTLTYEELTPSVLASHSLIVNTTPLGTYPAVGNCPPLPYSALTPHHYLFDLIYNPRETLFLQRGLAAGCHIQNGYEMLALQAEAAWAIWTAGS